MDVHPPNIQEAFMNIRREEHLKLQRMAAIHITVLTNQVRALTPLMKKATFYFLRDISMAAKLKK